MRKGDKSDYSWKSTFRGCIHATISLLYFCVITVERWRKKDENVRRVHAAWIKPDNSLLKVVGWFSAIGRETPMPIGDLDDYSTFPGGGPAWKRAPPALGLSLTEKKWWLGSILRGFWLVVVVCAIISSPLQTDAFLSNSKWLWKVEFVSKSMSNGSTVVACSFAKIRPCWTLHAGREFIMSLLGWVDASCIARDAAANSP